MICDRPVAVSVSVLAVGRCRSVGRASTGRSLPGRPRPPPPLPRHRPAPCNGAVARAAGRPGLGAAIKATSSCGRRAYSSVLRPERLVNLRPHMARRVTEYCLGKVKKRETESFRRLPLLPCVPLAEAESPDRPTPLVAL